MVETRQTRESTARPGKKELTMADREKMAGKYHESFLELISEAKAGFSSIDVIRANFNSRLAKAKEEGIAVEHECLFERAAYQLIGAESGEDLEIACYKFLKNRLDNRCFSLRVDVVRFFFEYANIPLNVDAVFDKILEEVATLNMT